MTKKEFDMFEQATYEILSQFKENIKIIIRDHGDEIDLHDLKDDIQTMLEDEGVELNEAYDDNVFNFISDDELVEWLEKEEICFVYTRFEYYVRSIKLCPFD